MRSLLGFLVFIAAVIALVMAFAVPPLVAPMVEAAVHDASPFGEQPIDVEVEVDAIGLLRGFVGEIRISGENLEQDDVTIGKLDVTVRGVRLDDHSFAGIDGGLTGVAVPFLDFEPLLVGRMALAGGSDELTATASLDHDAALAFITRSFSEQGVQATGIELIEGGVSVVIFEQRVDLAIAVADGALVIPDVLGTGPLELLAPFPEDPWRLTGVTASFGGLEIVAAVDAGALIAVEGPAHAD
jgi:hypothetical protein